MSAKTQVEQYVVDTPRFTTRQASEALGINISTVRKAVAALVTEGVLTRDNDSLVKKEKITRIHNKPKVSDILEPKFEIALAGISIVIPDDTTADEKRAAKAEIKTALDSVTFDNTKDEVAAIKSFSKYSVSHLAWYKSQYLHKLRTSLVETAE